MYKRLEEAIKHYFRGCYSLKHIFHKEWPEVYCLSNTLFIHIPKTGSKKYQRRLYKLEQFLADEYDCLFKIDKDTEIIIIR